MVLALTLLVASALPVTEVPRPGGPLKEAAVQVLLSENEVNIEPGAGQKRFKAARGMLLQKSDVVVVGPGAWVALAILANDHVVRLDDDLSLAVGDLALISAPKQSRTAVEQLDTLLTAQESARTERLIGWHASQTAANTQPVQLLLKRPSGGGTNTAESMKKTEEVVTRKDAVAVTKGGGGPGAPEKPVVSPPPPSPPPPPVVQAQPGPPREEKASTTLDPALQGCVDLAVAAWGPAVKAKLGASLRILVKTKDGEPLVKLPLGLPATSCLAEYFKKQALTANWTSVTVPLK